MLKLPILGSIQNKYRVYSVFVAEFKKVCVSFLSFLATLYRPLYIILLHDWREFVKQLLACRLLYRYL
jgi:hypothetical protein